MRMVQLLSDHPRLRAVAVVSGLATLAWILVRNGIDRDVVALVLLLGGLATKAFAAALGLVALIPIVGPLMVQVITLPIVLVINALAYVVTFFALRRGEAVPAIRAKAIAWSVFVGFLLGFLTGRSLP